MQENRRRYGALGGLFLAGLFSFVSVSAFPDAALALDALATPTGGAVVSGAATITTPSAGTLHVNQTSTRAVIDWASFNTGSGATTEFFQPSASSVALNRVTGGADPTQILGTLRSNGIIIVQDPNGVMFGNGAVVDVGGILATTGNVDMTVFNAGGAFGISSIDTGSIINNGNITAAEGGFVALVAPGMANNGVITARLGKVSLVAGKAVTVDFTGDQMISFAANSSFANVLIQNTGAIYADGGVVRMDVSSAKSVVDTVINTSGIVRADTVGTSNGKIILGSSLKGRSEISGTLSASDKVELTGVEAYVTGDVTAHNTGAIINSANLLKLDGRIYTAGGALMNRSQLSNTASSVSVHIISAGASIQQGIDLSGRATYLHSGTYHENVELYKQNALLQSGMLGEAAATMMGAGDSDSIVRITANGVHIDHINFSADIAGSSAKTQYGVKIEGIANGEVKDSTFTGFTSSGAGIYLTGTTRDAIFSNTFENTARGVLVENTTSSGVYSNTFNGTALGVEVDNGTAASVRGNAFSNVGTGIYVHDSANLDIRFNTMTDMTRGNLGIRADNVSGTTRFRGNFIKGTGHTGMTLNDSDGVTLDWNVFSGAKDGLYINNSDNVTLIRGVFATDPAEIAKWGSRRVEGTGLTIRNSTGTNIVDTWMDDAYSTAISLVNTDDTRITNSLITGNFIGLHMASDSGKVTLSDTTFENHFIGTWVQSGELELAGGNTYSGGDYGLKFDGSEHVALTGLTLSDTVFTGQSEYYVYLKNRAFFDGRNAVEIDGSGATYDGVLGRTATKKQIKAIEEKIYDYDDIKKLGQIFVGTFSQGSKFGHAKDKGGGGDEEED